MVNRAKDIFVLARRAYTNGENEKAMRLTMQAFEELENDGLEEEVASEELTNSVSQGFNNTVRFKHRSYEQAAEFVDEKSNTSLSELGELSENDLLEE